MFITQFQWHWDFVGLVATMVHDLLLFLRWTIPYNVYHKHALIQPGSSITNCGKYWIEPCLSVTKELPQQTLSMPVALLFLRRAPGPMGNQWNVAWTQARLVLVNDDGKTLLFCRNLWSVSMAFLMPDKNVTPSVKLTHPPSPVVPLETNFTEILVKTKKLIFKKMHLKISSVQWRPILYRGRWVNCQCVVHFIVNLTAFVALSLVAVVLSRIAKSNNFPEFRNAFHRDTTTISLDQNGCPSEDGFWVWYGFRWITLYWDYWQISIGSAIFAIKRRLAILRRIHVTLGLARVR